MAHPTVLVVDDDPQVLALVSRALAARDYDVVSMDCPLQALAFAQGRPSFDLLVSDVIMPGICGPELARRITEIWPNTAIVLMSGYLNREELPTKVELLIKPFALGDLLAAVERALAFRTDETQKKPPIPLGNSTAF